jgi:aldehyde dehydrogenase (NAD+)
VLRSYADLLSTFPFHEDVGHSVVVREPVGVVGAITPWNYPLYQIATKLGPALAAGCTMVLKPSETAPFDAMMLAELAIDAGLPAGVLNVVTGVGQVVGEALASHPAVDMVSFTGSTRVGRRISELGARTIKRVTLELGGKSASLVLPSAALEPAVRATVANAVYNSGQTCTAWTRLLVDHARYEEAVEIAADETKRQRLDDPQMPGDHLGPLATRAQFDKVRAMIRSGVERGARLVVGGAEAPAGLTNGFYVQPTLFADVTPDMMIAREEVFGPVLTAMSYTTVDEAVSIANDTDYGLAGAVWAGSDEEAWGVALRLRTGRVDLNGAPFNILAPTGGFKQSGNGRELGTYGLEEFCEMKSVQFSDPARLR